MSEETRTCRQGHPMRSKMGRDGKKHWFCNKCRSAAARKRRARVGSAGGRRMLSGSGWFIGGWADDEKE